MMNEWTLFALDEVIEINHNSVIEKIVKIVASDIN